MPTTEKPSKSRRPLRAMLKFLLVALTIIVTTGVALTLPLRWINPVTTSFILQNDARADRSWIAWDELPPVLSLSLIASEDQKFPFHRGFDFEAIADVLDDSTGPKRGASTITQQLARNLYLWPGKSLLRKGLEAYFTVLLETFLSKRRILELYLNVVEFGPKVFGIEQAAATFFSKSATDLNADEAALLIAVLPNPKIYSPSNPSRLVRERVSFIRQAVRYLGGISYIEDL